MKSILQDAQNTARKPELMPEEPEFVIAPMTWGACIKILGRKTMLTLNIAFALPLMFGSLAAQVVQITPLGLKTGELCFSDRAMILEDPTGLRILYDPGVVIAGSTD